MLDTSIYQAEEITLLNGVLTSVGPLDRRHLYTSPASKKTSKGTGRASALHLRNFLESQFYCSKIT